MGEYKNCGDVKNMRDNMTEMRKARERWRNNFSAEKVGKVRTAKDCKKPKDEGLEAGGGKGDVTVSEI